MSTAFPHTKPLYSKINLFNLAINKIIRAKEKSLTKVPSRSMGTAVPLPKETLQKSLKLLATAINEASEKGKSRIFFPFSKKLNKTMKVLERNGLIDEYHIRLSANPPAFEIPFFRSTTFGDKPYILKVSVLDMPILSTFVLEEAMRECELPDRRVLHSGETELYLVVETARGVHVLSTKSVTRAFWYKDDVETTPS